MNTAGRFRLFRPIAIEITLTLLLLNGTPASTNADELSAQIFAGQIATIDRDWNYRRTAYQYFARPPLLAIPFFVAGRRESGDVVRVPDWHVDERRSKCFPKLPTIDLKRVALPTVAMSNGKQLDGAFSASVAKIAELATQADYSSDFQVSLSFADAQIDEVSEGELSRAYNHSACPFLQPALGGRFDGEHALLGTVIWGRKDLLFVFRRERTGSADAGLVAKLTALLHLSAHVAASDSETTSLRVEESVATPIAFRPMFISYTDFLRRYRDIEKGLDSEIDHILSSAADAKSVAVAVRGRPEFTEKPQDILSAFVSGNLYPAYKLDETRKARYFRYVGALYVASLINARYQ